MTESPKASQPILIGTQRPGHEAKAEKDRDWEPVQPKAEEEKPGPKAEAPSPPEEKPSTQEASPAEESPRDYFVAESNLEESDFSGLQPPTDSSRGGKVEVPSARTGFTADLEAEMEAMLSGSPLDEIMDSSVAEMNQEMLEEESKHKVRVAAVQPDGVIVEIAGSREQGGISIRQFSGDLPAVGDEIEAIVLRFVPEDGLYEMSIPNVAADASAWENVREGMLLNATVTASNTGGLECSVGALKGFIPISQISLYRVENAEEFVGEHFDCVVTECNPARRNLVLSRKAVLEREREEAREKLLQSLAVGQIHEGIVRKLMDFGAFVDIGGVDGLLHISKLAWSRVNHPGDVLKEGERIKVQIEKFDVDTGKISFGYRDLLDNPWDDANRKYPVDSVHTGRVMRIMEFGAFVELEPGIEGLVHISELSHKRVMRVSDVVQEGDKVEVMVSRVDLAEKKIGLSMKALTQPDPTEEEKAEEERDTLADIPEKKVPNRAKGSLKGGVSSGGSDGEKFGLKW